MTNNNFLIITNWLNIQVVGYDNLLNMVNQLTANGYKVKKIIRL